MASLFKKRLIKVVRRG